MTLQIQGIDRPNIAAHMAKNSVIPTGAAQRAAQWRDLFCGLGDMRRSLDYAAPWAASLGMTESYAIALACRGTIAGPIPP
jgi:hypothetical protein